MKLFKTFLLLLVSQSILFSQSGWVQQNSGTSKYLKSCYFINDNTGFVVGNEGVILKTINGGNNWINIFNQTVYNAISVSFLNNNTGWVYIENNINSDSSFLLKTNNAGLSWNKYYIDSCNSFYFDIDFQFIDINLGYLTNPLGLKKTTNSGINWTLELNQPLGGVFFVNNLTGWVGKYGWGVYITTNGGLNWIQQEAGIQNQYGVDFYFHNSQTGFCTPKSFGSDGPLYSTTNGGSNWQRHLDIYSFRSIRFANVNIAYMIAFDWSTYMFEIAKTTNGGINWIIHNINTSRRLSKLFFSSVNTGWVVGDSGTIFKTTNGGVTIGINPISIEIPNNYSLSQNYPNPFNPNTKIRFDIPHVGDAYMRPVRLAIYDLLGREVTILVNEELKPGVYEVDFDGFNLPSGVYYYRLISGSFTQTKKMVLLK